MQPLGFSGALVVAGIALARTDLLAAQTVDELHEAGKFREVATLLEVSATAGNRRAQERVGFMYFYGEMLYGREFPRDPARAAHWLGKAAEQGSDVARYGRSLNANAPSPANHRRPAED